MSDQSVSMNVSISFTAATPEEGRATAEAIVYPEGANVSINASQVLASGVADSDGNVEAPPGVPIGPGGPDEEVPPA